MTIQSSIDASRNDGAGIFELLIEPESKDLGAFAVRRALPATQVQRVGPFIFFDHMGPAELAVGKAMDVRPHPHIGIATLTYLFAGEIMHRDSLGYAQAIQPGAVNWMTAGRGIVHSERSPESLRDVVSPLHGIQCWLALPIEQEEMDPSFVHYAADSIPELSQDGAKIRLITGSAFGMTSPVVTASETFYAAVELAIGGEVIVPADIAERAIYVVDGQVRAAAPNHAKASGTACSIEAGTMAVLRTGQAIRIDAQTPARIMLLGGSALSGERHLYWNFVSSRSERIEIAKQDWRAGRFDSVPGDSEFIPLPD